MDNVNKNFLIKNKVCPFCKSNFGFYTKHTYTGSGIYRYEFNGEVSENGDMYECLNSTDSKYTYCLNCDKRLLEHDEMKVYFKSKGGY
jgi:hypothetical protein